MYISIETEMKCLVSARERGGIKQSPSQTISQAYETIGASAKKIFSLYAFKSYSFR
jgi:hypothetical protein